MTMLDQAVIDAAALKEAALKNAEQMVLEKYAPQIKEALESFLEQDDLSVDLGSEESGMPAAEDPFAAELPLAATDGEKLCSCPEDDEEIEIDFDELSKLSNAGEESDLPGQTGELSPQEDGMFMEEAAEGVQVPSSLGSELHMYHMSMGDPVYKVGSLALAGKTVPSDLLEQAISQLQELSTKMADDAEKQELENLLTQLEQLGGMSAAQEENPAASAPPASIYENEESAEENEELSENDFLSLLEMLEVDAVPVPHGHAGHATSAERLESAQIELARAQDTKVAEENEALKKAIERLNEHNKKLDQQVKSLILLNNKVKGVALDASKKNEQLNLQNAKLAYKNRALESVSLNERQKMKIVEAISKVGSVNEAKVIFETLTKTFNSKQETNPLPKTLNEAINKNKGLSFRPREATESNDSNLDRMQKLAGIIK